jgi:CubicO group peptidase (beta-lactamase class C family)
MLAQVLIERFSNQTLPEFIGERIFKPLNMTSTSYSLSAALASGRASQAFDAAYRRIPLGLPDIDQALIAGAGGILSTAPDMLKWAKLLLGGWKDKEEDEIVPAKVREECMGAQTLLPRATKGKFGSGRVTYGFGWFQDEVSGVRVSP